MGRFAGLSGVAGMQVQIDDQSQATPEQRHGSPADPRHKSHNIAGVHPYPSLSNSAQSVTQHGPYGPENQLLSDFEWFIQGAGMATDDPYMDQTPSRRAGPFPKGISSGPVPGQGPDDIAIQLEQSAVIHGIKTNATKRSLYHQSGDVQQDNWMHYEQVNPGASMLAPLPRQSMSSGFMWGTRSREQSFARQNEYGFDSAHQWRRYAQSPIPGNFLWMRPGGRLLHKTLAGPARPPIGLDSPFHGDDLGAAFGIDGAVLQNVPTEYTPPATVKLATPTTWDQGPIPDVEFY